MQGLLERVYQPYILHEAAVHAQIQLFLYRLWQFSYHLHLIFVIPKLFLSPCDLKEGFYFYSQRLTDSVLFQQIGNEVEVVGCFKLICLGEQYDLQYFLEEIGKQKNGKDHAEDYKDGLNGVQRHYVSIGDRGHVADRKVHAIEVLEGPVAVVNPVVQGRVVDPAVVGGVWPVVVARIDGVVYREEAHCQVMRPQDSQKDHSKDGIDVTFLEPIPHLEQQFLIDFVGIDQFPKKQYFKPVRQHSLIYIRDDDCDQCNHVYPQSHPYVVLEDDHLFVDQNAVFVVGLDRTNYNVSYQDYEKHDVAFIEIVQLVLPESCAETEQKTNFKDVEHDDCQHQKIPYNQERMVRIQDWQFIIKLEQFAENSTLYYKLWFTLATLTLILNHSEYFCRDIIYQRAIYG